MFLKNIISEIKYKISVPVFGALFYVAFLFLRFYYWRMEFEKGERKWTWHII